MVGRPVLTIPGAPGRGGALGLDVAPSAAAATESVGSGLLVGLDAVPAVKVPQPALSKAAELRPW